MSSSVSPSRTHLMTIVAQDPSVGGEQGMLRASVPVPADRLEPGPRSHRFQVIDYDATARVLLQPAILTPYARAWTMPRRAEFDRVNDGLFDE